MNLLARTAFSSAEQARATFLSSAAVRSALMFLTERKRVLPFAAEILRQE